MGTCTDREDAESRKLTYAFLSRMFLEEVSEEFLGRMALDPPRVEGSWGKFAAALPSADLASVRTEAAAEYAALFLSMSADPVFPYESVYTSQTHLMMQQARDKAVAAYRANGFERSDALNVPEDHVGIELEFMAKLCQKELDALDAGDNAAADAARAAQRTFCSEHLLNWVPALCDDLERRAKSDLYRGLAEMTRFFLEFEREAYGSGSA